MISSRRRVPFVQQLAASDCAAACLAMVLRYHGKHVRLEEIRNTVGMGRDGADALGILESARGLGLRGRGVTIDVDDLDCLPAASILHWEFRHFVVFEGLSRRGIQLLDPAYGRRLVTWTEFRRSFTGVALILEPSEVFDPGGSRDRTTWERVRRIVSETPLLSRVVVSSLILQLLALSLPIMTGLIVDSVVPRGDYHLLLVVSAGLLSVVLFRLLAFLVRVHLLLHLQSHLDVQMTVGFVEHLANLPLSFFQQRSSGDLMMRVNSNTIVRELITTNTLSGMVDGALVMLCLLLMWTLSPAMAGLTFLLGLLRIGGFVVTRRRFADLNAKVLLKQSRSQSYEVELFAGMETLKSAGVERQAVGHWTELFMEMTNTTILRSRLAANIEAFMDSMGTSSPLLILAYGTAQVLEQRMTLGTMLAGCALATSVLAPLSTLVTSANKLQLAGSYLDRINEVLDLPAEREAPSSNDSFALRGGVELQGASYRYGSSSPAALRDASVRVEPGQMVAIVGRSGSGKSTLAKVLLGLYPPGSGRVLYDGVDLASLNGPSVRRQMGIVTQAPYIFGSSIRQNIALANPSTPMDRVTEAAGLAALHEDIASMPMGYDTVLSDGGASISAGQRQRLAIARALVQRPAILLLDEATSALDSVTESQVHQNLSSLQCTRIVIAHRLSTVIDADLILVMEDGAIVERGTHGSLLAAGGVYADLIAAQLPQQRRAVPQRVPHPGTDFRSTHPIKKIPADHPGNVTPLVGMEAEA